MAVLDGSGGGPERGASGVGCEGMPPQTRAPEVASEHAHLDAALTLTWPQVGTDPTGLQSVDDPLDEREVDSADQLRRPGREGMERAVSLPDQGGGVTSGLEPVLGEDALGHREGPLGSETPGATLLPLGSPSVDPASAGHLESRAPGGPVVVLLARFEDGVEEDVGQRLHAPGC